MTSIWVSAWLAMFTTIAPWLVLFLSTLATTGLRIAAVAFDYRLPNWHRK